MNTTLESAEAKDALKRGIDRVANMVKKTLGPKGRNIVLERQFGKQLITNDGVTIAKNIELEDPFENVGANLIKEAAMKSNDVAGDGTTTAIVLAQAMIEEGLKQMAVGHNPMVLRKGIERATEKVVENIKKVATPIKTQEEIAQVATISSGSEEVGKMIAEVIEVIGHDGVITVEEGQSGKLEKEVVKGMQIDQGYISPYMMNETVRMEANLQDALVLITDKTITSAHEIVPVLEQVVKSGKKEILIIADDVSGDALNTIILNKMRGIFFALCIKAPSFGSRKTDMLEDLAILTGATIVSDVTGLTLDKVTLDQLGNARQVISNKNQTTIVEGKGSKEAIDGRIEQIRKQIDTALSDFDKTKLQERLAKLTGGVGVIKVGAATEVELKEKKLRVEDAVEATKAAIAEGIVPGGGICLYNAGYDTDDIGEEIVMNCLDAPLKQIASNAGINGDIIARDLMKADSRTGWNAETEQNVDMIEAGIIDPAKVTRTALQSAASVAMMVLTTEGIVCDKREKENNNVGGENE